MIGLGSDKNRIVNTDDDVDNPDFADAPNPSRSSLIASAALEVKDQDSIGLCCKVFYSDFDHNDNDPVDDRRDRGIQTEPRPSLLRQLCLCFLSNQVSF